MKGCINLDLSPISGVDVVADAHDIPFGCGQFQRVECDARQVSTRCHEGN